MSPSCFLARKFRAMVRIAKEQEVRKQVEAEIDAAFDAIMMPNSTDSDMGAVQAALDKASWVKVA